MRVTSMKRILLLGVLVCGLVGGTTNVAFATTIFSVAIDTLALSGTSAQLAFDFIDGDFTVNNAATITNFSTDGILGAASSFGGPVTGTLPGTTTIGDTDFFNELLQPITLASSISFTLELTEAFAGGLADQFSFFILDDDPFFPLPLFFTTDPTFADALFAVDITGASGGGLNVITAASGPAATWDVTAVTAVPEPSSMLLFGTGVLAFAAYRRRNRDQLTG